jgi:hypothetical protein
MTSEERAKARDVLLSGVVRAARRLRDQGCSHLLEEPELAEAWDSLNDALTTLDDFAARMLEPA